jgi:hypothetical protein
MKIYGTDSSAVRSNHWNQIHTIYAPITYFIRYKFPARSSIHWNLKGKQCRIKKGHMSDSKAVKDLIINISEYPHVPQCFSVSQAIKIVKASFIKNKECSGPPAILVFDEQYQLLGEILASDLCLCPFFPSQLYLSLSDKNSRLGYLYSAPGSMWSCNFRIARSAEQSCR